MFRTYFTLQIEEYCMKSSMKEFEYVGCISQCLTTLTTPQYSWVTWCDMFIFSRSVPCKGSPTPRLHFQWGKNWMHLHSVQSWGDQTPPGPPWSWTSEKGRLEIPTRTYGWNNYNKDDNPALKRRSFTRTFGIFWDGSWFLFGNATHCELSVV